MLLFWLSWWCEEVRFLGGLVCVTLCDEVENDVGKEDAQAKFDIFLVHS